MTKRIALGLFIIFGLLFWNKVYAVESGISVYPAQFADNLKPGEAKEYSIFVENHQKTEYSVQTGFILKENYNKTEDLKAQSLDWFTISNIKDGNFDIKTGQNQELKIQLTVPNNTSTKGYIPLLVIRFSPKSSLGSTSNISEFVIDFLLSVENPNQKLDYRALISELRIEKLNIFLPEVTFSTKIENNGNVFFRPKGIIHIYDSMGVEQNGVQVINENAEYLFQGENITQEFTWRRENDSIWDIPFGNYKAKVSLSNIETGELVEKETTFFVFPTTYFTIFVMILIIIITFLILSKNLKGKHNKGSGLRMWTFLFVGLFALSNLNLSLAQDTSTDTYKITDATFGSSGGETQNTNQRIMSAIGSDFSAQRITTSLYSVGEGPVNEWMANVPKVVCFETTSDGSTYCVGASVSPNGMVMLCGDGGCYDRARFEIEPQNNPAETLYSIQLSTDPSWSYGTWKYLKNDFSLTTFNNHSINDYQTKSYWEDTTPFNITGLAPGKQYYIRITALRGDFSESTPSPVATATTAYPEMTFTVSPNTIEINPSSNVATANSQISLVVGTNLASGITIKGLDISNGLYNAVAGSTIPSVDADLDITNIGFGIVQSSVSQSYLGPLQVAVNYGQGGNIVGGLYTTPSTMYDSSNKPIKNGQANLYVKAKIQDSTKTGNYQDTLIFRLQAN